MNDSHKMLNVQTRKTNQTNKQNATDTKYLGNLGHNEKIKHMINSSQEETLAL